MSTVIREQHQATASKDRQAAGRKYLTFALDRGEYGVPVQKVREIIKVLDITAVPQVPPYVKGVINLRGKVIPVVDLRLKFGLPAAEFTDHSCIIVVEVMLKNSVMPIGVVVDSVADVMSISSDELEDAPELTATDEAACVEALAKVRGSVKIILNLERILGTDGEAMRTGWAVSTPGVETRG